MFKSFREVGFLRIMKYFVYGLWDFFFRLLPFSPLRVWWLRLGGASLGANCVVDRITLMNLDRTGLSGLKIGKDCYLGPQVILDLAGRISLGSQVTVTAGSTILSHHSVGYSDHPLIKHYPKKMEHTHLNSGCVVSAGSIILPGVTVGEASLVGAGSVVNKDVPAMVLSAGVPAETKKHLP
jgi:acetyltransferase-like isoleucine patch superfamily enzyme